MKPTELTLRARQQGISATTVKRRIAAGLPLDEALAQSLMPSVKPSCRDLSGQSFGHFTVLRPHEERSHGGRQWVCRCICEKEVLVTTSLLRSGQRTSCGCEGKGTKILDGTRCKDLTGQRFGRLVAETLVGTRRKSGLWRTRCDCGRVKNVPAQALRSGGTSSCGCLRRGNAPKERDLVGHRFGKLEVTHLVRGTGAITRVWDCRCDCGATTEKREQNLLAGQTQSCGTCRYRVHELFGQPISATELAALAGIPAYTMNCRLAEGWTPERAISVPLRTGMYTPPDGTTGAPPPMLLMAA